MRSVLNKGGQEKTGRSPLSLSLIVLFLASIFVVSLTRIHDVDAWMHLSLGKLIWELKGFPEREVFMYPYLDMPFFYTSWLFGLAYYLVYELFNVHGLVLFKAAIITVGFLVMLGDALRPRRQVPVAVVVLIFFVILAYDRFVSRPEILVMTFLPLSVFCLNAYYFENRKYLYALPLVHLLWANTHTSIPLILVVFLSFIGGGFLQRYLKGNRTVSEGVPSNAQLRTVALIFAASLAASQLSPYGIDQFTYGAGILSAEWNTRFVEELLPPIGTYRALLYTADAIIALSFLINRRDFKVYHLFLIVPFMVMPFISVRFSLYLALAGGPVVARNLSGFFGTLEAGRIVTGRAAHLAAAVGAVIVCALILTVPRALGLEEREPGFSFDYAKMPRGAVEYMDENNIEGRVLNTYHFGQYIIWTGYPERTVYTDGRAALSNELLQKLTAFRTSNAVLDELYRTYGFECILIEYPFLVYDKSADHTTGVSGRRYVPFSHPSWAPVYWDDISILYLRRDGRYDGLIASDEYRHITPDMGVTQTIEILSDRERAGQIAREIERNTEVTGSSRAYALLGMSHSLNGNHAAAIRAFNDAGPLGDADYEYAVTVFIGDSHAALGDTERGLRFYERSLELRRNPLILVDAGKMHLSERNYEKANGYLTEAVEINEKLLEAYPPLIESYEKLYMVEEAGIAREQYQRMLQGENN